VSSRQPDPPPALIAEATKRAGVIWIKAGGGRARPAWHVWHDGAAYLLTGPGEQPLPGLGSGRPASVLVRSRESGGLLLTWEATVSRVEPGSPAWEAVIGLLAASRLNAPPDPGRGTPIARWAAACTVFRLQPAAGPGRQ
jgi:hypothetical protein